MLQNFKKLTIFNRICLILVLFPISMIQTSSAANKQTTRAKQFLEELTTKPASSIDHDKLLELIQEGMNLEYDRNSKNDTPLLAAVRYLPDDSNGQKVIEALINEIRKENEPLIYSQDSTGNTPLSLAAQSRKHNFYNMLYRVYTYEQQEIVNKKGLHAIDYKNLVDRTDKFFKLIGSKITAISQNLMDQLSDLIKKGIEFNFHHGFLQETPLTIAIKNLPDNRMGKEIVESLLREGAYYDSTNFAGTTALSIAIQESKPGFAQLLLNFGANPNMTDTNGKTPKDYAQESTHQEIKSLFTYQERNLPKQSVEYISNITADEKTALIYFGLNPNQLTLDDLKTVPSKYRKLAVQYHPDKNKGNEEEATKKFKILKNNYDALKDLLGKSV